MTIFHFWISTHSMMNFICTISDINQLLLPLEHNYNTTKIHSRCHRWSHLLWLRKGLVIITKTVPRIECTILSRNTEIYIWKFQDNCQTANKPNHQPRSIIPLAHLTAPTPSRIPTPSSTRYRGAIPSSHSAKAVCNFQTVKLLFQRNNRIWRKSLVCKSSSIASNQVI